MRFWYIFVGGVVFLVLTKQGGHPIVTDYRIKRIAEAIAQAEGFGPPHNLTTRNNNPGAIRDNSLPGAPIKIYPSLAEGWNALYRQVSGMLKGSALYPVTWTLEQVAARYTGEVAYMNWARNVARVLGVPTNIVFSEIP